MTLTSKHAHRLSGHYVIYLATFLSISMFGQQILCSLACKKEMNTRKQSNDFDNLSFNLTQF